MNRLRDDEGLTLFEVLISMTIMAVVMSVFTGGVLLMYRTLNRADADAVVQLRTTTAFTRLEREIRYAKRIFTQVAETNGWTVRFVMVDPDDGVEKCVQLWLPATDNDGDAGRVTLVERRWPTTGASTAGTFRALAPGFTPPAGTPFAVQPLDDDSNFDRLTVTLSTGQGAAGRGAAQSYNLTYTAQNTVPAAQRLTTPPGLSTPCPYTMPS